MSAEPALSVVVRIVGGGHFLRRCLAGLACQTDGASIEVIVPFDSTVSGIEPVRSEFPRVTFVDMGVVKTDAAVGSGALAHELYDRRSAAGFSAGRGTILAQIEDYAVPDADWCQRVLDAHRLPHGVIGGAVLHGGQGVLNWAVYFSDFWRYTPPLPEGPASYVTDINVSYKRTALDSVREVWRDRYNEVVVHHALNQRGVLLWLRPDILVCIDRGRLSVRGAVLERFFGGRLFAAVRIQGMSPARRLVYITASPALPALLLFRMGRRALRSGDKWDRFLVGLPYLLILTVCWCVGEMVGYATRRPA